MKARSLKRFHFSFKTFALLFLCVTLLAGLLPENVSAASSIGLSAYAPRPGSGTITISWDKVSNASFYAYSVRDTTTNASICDRTQTSKAYAKVSHTWEAGHSYRVWAGACCEGNDPDNTSTWDYTGMTTFTVEACAHSNTDVAWDTSRSITYTSVSDTQHQMKGYQYEYCTSCFEHIGSSYKVTETVGHDFDKNGDCPSCGYTHACAHTRTKLVEIDGYPAYIQDSETKHIVDIQYKRVCRDCDAVVDKLVDSERVYQREEHDFNSKGVCRDCGYVKPAQQEPLKISVSASPSSAETGATLSASAAASGGDGSYSFSWKVTCDGNVVANTDLSYGSSYNVTASKAGSYVFTATVRDGNSNQVSASSGTITVKAPACQHPSTEIAWDTSRAITYKSVSDNTHTMTGYQYKYCTICFERVGDSFSASETVSHNFDSNGDCPSCGYTHACPHSQTNLAALDGYPAYRPDSETQHIVDIQYKKVCADCNAVVSKLVDSARVYKRENHNFNENGTCRSCGYVKPAQQVALKVSVSASPSSAETGATLSASAAASGGDGNYSFSWKVTCDGNVVANTDLSYGSSYNHTASKAGSYVFTATVRDGNGNQVSASSGTITVKAPAHVHNYKEKDYDYSNYVNQNANEHDVTITYTMKCDGCGDETARKTKTVRAAHAYTSKGHIEGKHQDGKGHATFDRCACGAAKYTGYAKYGSCCTCYGHAWGSAYLQGEQWLQKCTRCGRTQTTTAPTVDPATCSHVWDEGHYQEEHPHAYLYTCVKCGYVSTTGKVLRIDTCCDCVGHLYLDDDYSKCLRCGERFRCEHEGTISYSEHPHVHAYWECEIDGLTIELDDLHRPNGRELSWCSSCFPQDRIENEHLDNMAKWSQVAYDTGALVDSALEKMGDKSSTRIDGVNASEEYRDVNGVIVSKTGRKGIYEVNSDTIDGGFELGISGGEYRENSSQTMHVSGLRITEESGFPDSFIQVTNTADGELVMTIAFEGSQEGWEDWIDTNARTKMNEDGVHTGFANIAKEYINGIFNDEYFVNCTIDGVTKNYRLDQVLSAISSNDKAHIRITGHSLGGAAAQCLTYYLVKEDRVNKHQIETYTFASPIPFGYDAIKDDTYRNMNVYNFINVNDFVPDIGVSKSNLIVNRLAEELGAAAGNRIASSEYNGGYSIAGTNLGTNVYLNSDDLTDWTKPGFAGDHSMYATYLKLVDGYMDGSLPSYELDTDIFYSKHYDHSYNDAYAEFIDISEVAVKALKITRATAKAGSWAADLLDLADAAR